MNSAEREETKTVVDSGICESADPHVTLCRTVSTALVLSTSSHMLLFRPLPGSPKAFQLISGLRVDVLKHVPAQADQTEGWGHCIQC